jgi:hypothetical protein
MKRLIESFPVATAALAAALGGACGNYSNEDVDYQLALPEKQALAAKLPTQAALVVDSAEYYLFTREVAGRFNAILDALTGIIDLVRVHPPSQRTEDGRIWGPFRHQKHPSWALRLEIVRQADETATPFGYRFQYRLEFRRAAEPAAPWQALISGRFLPAGGVRKGRGEITLDLTHARRAGYPVAEFGELARLTIDYQTAAPPIRVDMTFENVPESANPSATYQYAETGEGSGSLFFVWRDRTNIWVQAAEIRSRWIGSGAGRADARIVEGVAASLRGVDCWGPDTRAVYAHRDWGDEQKNAGNEADCPLPAP